MVHDNNDKIKAFVNDLCESEFDAHARTKKSLNVTNTESSLTWKISKSDETLEDCVFTLLQLT